MRLENLGFTDKIKDLIGEVDLSDFAVARVIAVHKERYTIQTPSNTLTAEITGNLRYSAKDSADFPAVGDWVKAMILDDTTGVILEVFPRLSILKRQAVGKYGETQVIAANIDCAFITQAVEQDYNLNRLERYLAICHSTRIQPVIILTKTDLIEPIETRRLIGEIRERMKDVRVLPLSIMSEDTLCHLDDIIKPGLTYCFVGSSGVGKSSIINALRGTETMKTQEISTSTHKGKHTTTHRELIILPNGGIVIDTPGMREVGMINDALGIEVTYDTISQLSQSCRFNDCSHENETDCAVLAALESGELSTGAYENYQKLKREQERFNSTVREKRERDRSFGKLYKTVLKEHRKKKF